jgi:hypothetical protein
MMDVLTSKRRAVSRGKITARISGRSHFSKEKEAKNYYPSHAPLPQLAESSPKSAELPFLTIWPGLRMTPSVHQLSAKCAQVPAKEPRDQCGAGGENVISSFTLQLMVISRNLFYNTGGKNLLLPYCNAKVCLPLLYEL